MALVGLTLGVIILRYVETRLVAGTGETVALAAAEITDKLDRLLFERYGDALMMAHTFGRHDVSPQDLTDHLHWMKQAYSPVYLWLGVTDRHGHMVAATEPTLVGHDFGDARWFQRAQQEQALQVGDVGPDEVVRDVQSLSFTAPILGLQGEWLGVVTTRVGIPMLANVLTGTLQAMQHRDGFLGTIEYQFLTRAGDIFIDSEAAWTGVNLKEAGAPSALRSATGERGYVEETHFRRHVPILTGYAKTQGYGDFPGLQWRC